MGRDPATFDLLIADGPSGNVPDQPSSVGYHESRAVWYASGAADPSGRIRDVGAWADAYPGVVSKPSGTTSDPYKSKVVSQSYATPAFFQDQGDPSTWIPDTGLLPQKVAVAGGVDLPGGTPVVVVPFSIATEQQMAAIPASNQLVAVWFGGPPNGRLGTLVYDVTTAGELDKERRARIHSSMRVYRLPKLGLIPFGADPNAAKKPFPVSSGLAWQLGLDIDSQAGYGVIVDQIAPTPPKPPGPPRTATGIPSTAAATGTSGAGSPGCGVGNSTAPPTSPILNAQSPSPSPVDPASSTGATVSPPTPTTTSGPSSPTGVPSTKTKPNGGPTTASNVSVFGVTGKRGFGGHSVGRVDDIHHIATTPDDEPVNTAHWNVLQPIDGDGFDAPLKTAGEWEDPTGGGPLITETFFVYDIDDSHPYIGGRRVGLRKWETHVPWDVPPPVREKTCTDKGATDKKDSDFTKPPQDDKGINDKAISDNQTKPGQDETFTKPPQDDKGINDKAISDNQTKPGQDPGIFEGGKLGGGFAEQTIIPGLPNPTDIGAGFTFGGGILYGSGNPIVDGFADPQSTDTISVARAFARTPLEAAVPGLLGRPVPCYGPDTRGRTMELTPEQFEAYDGPVPIAAALSAFGDQSGGSPRWFPGSGPGTGLYDGGIANAGGFVLHPANMDVKDIQAGRHAPPRYPQTSLMVASGAKFALGEPTTTGLTRSGFNLVRDFTPSTVQKLSIFTTDSFGVEQVPAAMELDSIGGVAKFYGATVTAFGPQTANFVFAGPTGGPAAAPAFRLIVNADMPVVDVPHGGTGLSTYTIGDIPVATAATTIGVIGAGTSGYVLTSNGAGTPASFQPAGGGGSQAANTVFSGPTSGGPAAPTFRLLVPADIPSLDAAKITTGIFPVAQGGTGVSSASQNYGFMGPTVGAGAPAFRLLVSADIPNLDASQITTGTLPVAQGGTGLSSTSQNFGFLGPTVGAGAPTFRLLVAGDIPNLDASKITTGTLAVARGGTNLGSYTTGDLLYASAATTVAGLAAAAAGTVLTSNGAGVAPSYQTPTASLNPCFYGDGSDGAADFDGTNTFGFATKVGNVYTLTRDVYLNGATVRAVVTIKANAFRIHDKDTFTTEAGSIIHADGANGSSGSGGGGGVGGGQAFNTVLYGTQGGAGSNNPAASPGGNAVNPRGGLGGAGGSGGSGAGAAAGTFPTASSLALKGGSRAMPFAVMGMSIANSPGLANTYPIEGGGGGGGGRGEVGNGGGGGGAGGGHLILCVKTFVWNGTLRAAGGNGGNGTTGNTGGGGAGGGGYIMVASSSISGTQVSSVVAGTAGTGFGTGTAGSAGAAGNVMILC